MPLPNWWAERMPHDGADWSRQEADKGDEDLECPPLLKPHLQELLGGEELFLAGTEVPDNQESPPLYQSDWIQWHAPEVETPTWWRELLEVPGNDNCWEFAQKVHASFEVLKAHNWEKG